MQYMSMLNPYGRAHWCSGQKKSQPIRAGISNYEATGIEPSVISVKSII